MLNVSIFYWWQPPDDMRDLPGRTPNEECGTTRCEGECHRYADRWMQLHRVYILPYMYTYIHTMYPPVVDYLRRVLIVVRCVEKNWQMCRFRLQNGPSAVCDRTANGFTWSCLYGQRLNLDKLAPIAKGQCFIVFV